MQRICWRDSSRGGVQNGMRCTLMKMCAVSTPSWGGRWTAAQTHWWVHREERMASRMPLRTNQKRMRTRMRSMGSALNLGSSSKIYSKPRLRVWRKKAAICLDWLRAVPSSQIRISWTIKRKNNQLGIVATRAPIIAWCSLSRTRAGAP